MSQAVQLDLLDGRRKRRNPVPRTSEHQEQVTLMQWARMHEKRWPELELLHAVPNGGHRFIQVARAMKAEGCKPGVPDLHLPVARGPYHSLWIELKAKGGKLSEAQRWWIARLREAGHYVEVCFGWEDARDLLLLYLSGRFGGG